MASTQRSSLSCAAVLMAMPRSRTPAGSVLSSDPLLVAEGTSWLRLHVVKRIGGADPTRIQNNCDCHPVRRVLTAADCALVKNRCTITGPHCSVRLRECDTFEHRELDACVALPLCTFY